MADWYESFFGGVWLDLQRTFFPAEQSERRAEMLERVLALRPGSRVLDAPCGNGRLTIPLARRGYTLTGIDFTSSFLAEGRAAAGDLPITFLERDMRQLDDLSGFDAAFNFWGSFGFFDDAGDQALAAGIFRALVPGGRFLIDANLIETLMPIFQPRSWGRIGDTTMLEERLFDFATSRIRTEWTFLRAGVEERKSSSIRLYSGHEMVALLERVGFRSVRLLDFVTEGPLTVASRRALVVATKPA
ncbi:MAG TPA: methyltransferase domain-containing protein [Polyangia bacterium]|nr:methyltransferase domain-containing protein [Polyangia bacterium]